MTSTTVISRPGNTRAKIEDPKRHQEELAFEAVQLATRSYK